MRRLSFSQFVTKVLEQREALDLFFTAKAFESKAPQAERIQQALKSPYTKATLEFMDYVLSDLTGLTTLFQSNDFQLHKFLPEVERVLRMLSLNSMQSGCADDLSSIDVDDEAKWVALANVYHGILAKETIKHATPPKRKLSYTMPGLVQKGYPRDLEAG